MIVSSQVISIMKRSTREKKGQAMVEYAIVAGILLAGLSVVALLLFAFREYGGRILDLVASEYP